MAKAKQDRIDIAPFLPGMTDEDNWLDSIPRNGLKLLFPAQPGYFAKVNHKTPPTHYRGSYENFIIMQPSIKLKSNISSPLKITNKIKALCYI